jgi:ribonuclease D
MPWQAVAKWEPDALSSKAEKLKIPAPVWITDSQQLQQYCADWAREAYVSVDTEFVRTSTFFPKAGLIQVADKKQCYLIDPLKIKDWQPFADFLTNPLVIKVFHACAEDLEVCQHLTGVTPTPVADTQVGAALGGVGGIMGFQRLVKAILNIELDKGETRSDWLKRPLTDNQVRYAVADVYYLQKLYPKLVTRMKAMGRLSWWHEDCHRFITEANSPESFANYYRRIKLAWKLRPQEQYLLQQLAAWRESEARRRDLPRGQVIADNVLWNMARYKPMDDQGLTKAGVKNPLRRQVAETLLDIISQGLQVDKEEWPTQLARPLSPAAGEWHKMLKKAVAEKAEVLEIPADMLVKKKTLEALLRSGYPRGPYELPEPLNGWRKKEIADYLLVLLQEKSSPVSV